MIIKEGMYVHTADEFITTIFLSLCEEQGVWTYSKKLTSGQMKEALKQYGWIDGHRSSCVVVQKCSDNTLTLVGIMSSWLSEDHAEFKLYE
jgi:hypothetical protein